VSIDRRFVQVEKAGLRIRLDGKGEGRREERATRQFRAPRLLQPSPSSSFTTAFHLLDLSSSGSRPSERLIIERVLKNETDLFVFNSFLLLFALLHDLVPNSYPISTSITTYHVDPVFELLSTDQKLEATSARMGVVRRILVVVVFFLPSVLFLRRSWQQVGGGFRSED